MQTTKYQVKIDTKIEQVDAVAWDAMCGERPFTNVYWLTFLEKILADYQPSYVQLWQGERLVAGALCQPQRHFYLSAYLKNRVLHKVATQALAWLPPNACALPLFLRDGLIIHPEVDTAVWLPKLLHELEKISGKRWAPFTYLGNLDPAFGDVAEQAGYAVVPILQDTQLTITWRSFEAYLAHLTSKRRKRVRTYTKRAEEAGVVVREVNLDSVMAPQIERLIYGVADKHENTFLYKPDFLAQAQAHLRPDTAATLVACIGDEAVAAITLLYSQGELTAKLTGMNYERTYDTYAYHYLMISVVKKAIALGVSRLDFGPTSYVLKRQLGALFEDRVAALKVGVRPFNAAFKRVVQRSANDAAVDSENEEEN